MGRQNSWFAGYCDQENLHKKGDKLSFRDSERIMLITLNSVEISVKIIYA